MSYRMMLIALALVVITLTGIACQKGQREEPQGMVEAEVWVLPDSLIAEQVWLYFSDKPEECFERATSDLDTGRTKLAAHDLRTAAAYLKIEAQRGRGDSKKALKEAIHELEHSASRIEDGAVLPTKAMESMFARAHYALAEHHYERAAGLWKNDEQIEAGKELDVAAAHTEHGIGWVTSHPDEARTSVLAEIYETAGEMTEGKLMPPGSISKTMTALEKEIRELKMKLEPAH
jgi:hypothetical protein